MNKDKILEMLDKTQNAPDEMLVEINMVDFRSICRAALITESNLKIKTVLNYIKTNNMHIAATTIIATLLDCDFRDSKQKLDEWYESNT